MAKPASVPKTTVGRDPVFTEGLDHKRHSFSDFGEFPESLISGS